MIRTYLVDVINDHKTQSEWKIQLTAAINFISSKPDSEKTRIMHAKSDNIEIMIGSETNEFIEELFESLLIHNLKRENQVTLLMITDDGEKWHYLVVKSLSALLRRITSKHDGDLYCFNCFHSIVMLQKRAKKRQQNIKIQPW